MFEVNQQLLNPKFEGYRLAPTNQSIIREVLELPAKAYNEEVDNACGTQFQVLADRIYRNLLFLADPTKIRIFLENGQVIEASRNLEGLKKGFSLNGSIPIVRGIPSSAGNFIANGKSIFINQNGKWHPLSIQLDHEQEEITLLDSFNDNFILFYQVIEEKLKQGTDSSRKTTQASIFMATLIDLTLNKQITFKSKTRPLIGKIVDEQTVWLGSPTGFYFGSDVVDESDDFGEPLTYGLDDRDDEEAEEISEEAALNHLVLRAFSLDGTFTALGPPSAFIGAQVDSSDSLLFAIQNGVDMTIHDEKSHLGTINAFGFIQSGKSQKKFISFSASGSLALLTETSRIAYIYDHINNDKGEWARQFLLDFGDETDSRILGVQEIADGRGFLILFPKRLELIILA